MNHILTGHICIDFVILNWWQLSIHHAIESGVRATSDVPVHRALPRNCFEQRYVCAQVRSISYVVTEVFVLSLLSECHPMEKVRCDHRCIIIF